MTPEPHAYGRAASRRTATQAAVALRQWPLRAPGAVAALSQENRTDAAPAALRARGRPALPSPTSTRVASPLELYPLGGG